MIKKSAPKSAFHSYYLFRNCSINSASLSVVLFEGLDFNFKISSLNEFTNSKSVSICSKFKIALERTNEDSLRKDIEYNLETSSFSKSDDFKLEYFKINWANNKELLLLLIFFLNEFCNKL